MNRWIIVHPQSTPAGISRELDELERLPTVHFDVLSMAVYPGTQMHKTLLRDGRVTGGLFALRFEPRDVVVNRFRAALIRLRLEAVGRYGANIFAHDVAVNVALARRLGLPGYTPALELELSAALEVQNRVRLRALRHVFALAECHIGDTERATAMATIVRELAQDLVPTVERLEAIQHRLEGSPPGRIAHSNLMIASSMAAGFVLTLVATACGGEVAGVAVRRGDSTDAGLQHSSGPMDASAMMVGVGGGGGSGGSVGVIPLPPEPDAASCRANSGSHVLDVLRARCHPCEDTQVPYGVAIDPKGNVVDVVSQDGSPVPSAVRQCYLGALASQKFPCLNGEDVWYECVTLLR